MNTSKDILADLRFNAFRAVDNPAACERFLEGHANVLKSHGIKKLTSANNAWCLNPCVFVITVESLSTGKMIAGARVDVMGGTTQLPIADAVKEKDPSIFPLLNQYHLNGGTGEICGLWIDKDMLGIGLAVLLLRADLSIVSQLDISSLFFLCSPHTFKMLNRMGCRIEPSLGNNGTFYYPKEDLVATALIIKDVHTLVDADEIERERIFSLRNDPCQSLYEQTPNGIIKSEYDLIIPSQEKAFVKNVLNKNF